MLFLNQLQVQVLLTKFPEKVVSHGFDADQDSCQCPPAPGSPLSTIKFLMLEMNRGYGAKLDLVIPCACQNIQNIIIDECMNILPTSIDLF